MFLILIPVSNHPLLVSRYDLLKEQSRGMKYVDQQGNPGGSQLTHLSTMPGSR